MNIHVHTAEGVATICGDVLYDINDQLVEPFRQTQDAEPQTTANHGLSKRAEKGAIKKLLANARFLLPVHDRPCKVEGASSPDACKTRRPVRSCSPMRGGSGSPHEPPSLRAKRSNPD